MHWDAQARKAQALTADAQATGMHSITDLEQAVLHVSSQLMKAQAPTG